MFEPNIAFSLKKKKALIILDVQNDSFFVKDKVHLVKNHDFVPRLKKLIPHFRKDTTVFWARGEMERGKILYQEGTEGAQIYHELLDVVDETKDIFLIKAYPSAFKQTSLLVTLRKHLITDIYLCGCLTDVSIYSTAVDAAAYGFHLHVIGDCLGYRSEEKHVEAVGQMIEMLAANVVYSEGVLNGDEDLSVPDLSGLGLSTYKDGGKETDLTSSRSTMLQGEDGLGQNPLDR